MSRNIKTVECLKKHEGKTVKVIANNGSVFEATVEIDRLGGPVLYTASVFAKSDNYWWPSPSHEGFGHHCAKDFQITEELRSLTLLPSRKKKTDKSIEEREDTSKTILDMTVKELLEKLNEFIICKQ